MGLRLFDAHVHLDFYDNAVEVAQRAAARGIELFAVTVTPRDHEAARPLLAGCANVHLAVGLHPWWVARGQTDAGDVARACELAARTRFVGEVGMDLSPRHVPEGSAKRQREAFVALCTAAARGSDAAAPSVLSVHAVRSAGACLDVLYKTGCLERCHVVFHWFSGSSDELHRAVVSGCLFSVNEMMLATRRGREYARQLPLDQLLIETDLPKKADETNAADGGASNADVADGADESAREIAQSLERCVSQVARLRHMDESELAMRLAANAERLLS